MAAKAVGGTRSPKPAINARPVADMIWSLASKASMKGTPSTDAAPKDDIAPNAGRDRAMPT